MQQIKTFLQRVEEFRQKTFFTAKYLLGLAAFHWRRSLPHLQKFHINTFPAVQLKEFNRLDLAMKFSAEIVLIGIASAVGIWSVANLQAGKTYTDNSHLGRVIAKNPDLNRKLYNRMSVLNTVVLAESRFISYAQAEDFFTSPIDASYIEQDLENNLVWSGDSITQPNPDSVQELLKKQIKVYQTQSGDTLAKIAKENGISTQTLMWANKLTSQTIKPGWFLIILPADGVLHKATSNNTLPDLAKKYGVKMETIIAYNGLENAEDIDQDQLLIIPGGKMPEAPKPQTATPKPNDGKVNPSGSVKPKVVNNGLGHVFPWGYCTWYVATKVYVPWGGNAKNWLDNARGYGATISKTAVPGSIVVTTDNTRYGHVAYVESVDEKGFTVSEMNYEKFGKTNTRFIPHNSKIIRGFILR